MSISLSANNMSDYLHTYEAYRVPKGTAVKNANGEDIVLSHEEDTLVLTEKSGRQLVADRRNYGEFLQQKAELAAEKTQEAAREKITRDEAKAMAVFRSLANGDNVPSSDESKLMEYDAKLYQMAKSAQAMAQMAKKRAESKESEWDEREEEELRKKMKQLGDESNEAALAVGKGSGEFGEAQKRNIVVIDSGGVDFSSMKTMSLGGVTGEFIDLSV